ncbi:hypothetical protein BDQ12DRAFT_690702 [Crucibulum laeve]|uniref:Uncharacterized protein n=1 Tax=Crucibulum laeve TaxID=68775 RepID=A0A5C3LN43_9AGAR|nr:hypothetical protein BDQ12DRAFT_690702 [Crucibulum laeve]
MNNTLLHPLTGMYPRLLHHPRLQPTFRRHAVRPAPQSEAPIPATAQAFAFSFPRHFFMSIPV